MKDILKNFIAVDIETTGLDQHSDRIIELAAVKFENGEEVDSFHSLSDPGREISEFITELTGITNEDLRDQPHIDKVLSRFYEFIGEDPLVLHNAPFDIGFIEQNSGLYSMGRKLDYLDTLVLARAAWPFLGSYKLGKAAEHWQIEIPNAHRAEDDARATGLLFLGLNETWMNYSLDTVNDSINLSKEQIYKKYFKAIAKKRSKIKTRYANTLIPPPSNYLVRKKEFISVKPDLKKVFSRGGLIAEKLENYEHRQWQEELSEKIGEALNDEKIGMIEAGTGTGKSFAYLVPAIIFSIYKKEKVLISTKTKALQDQLFFKDVPFLHEIFEGSFSASLLKGKNNYLCKKRIQNTIEFQLDKLTAEKRLDLLPALTFRELTQTGDISEIAKADARKGISTTFGADRLTCIPTHCVFKNNCYWMKARQQAAKSNLIITNHSLLMADLNLENGILSECRHIIMDEAHHIEKVATSFLGDDLSLFDISGFFEYFFKSRKSSDHTELHRIISTIQEHSILGFDDIVEIEKKRDTIVDEADKYLDICGVIFDGCTEFIKAKSKSDARFGVKFRIKDEGVSEAHVRHAIKLLEDSTKKLITAITDIYERLKDVEQDEVESLLVSLDMAIGRLGGTTEFLSNLVYGSGENVAHWMELDSNQRHLFLHSWPIKLQEVLRETLFKRVSSIVLVSATLSIQNNFKYFKLKLGLNEIEENKFVEAIMPSGFNLEEQILFCLPSFLPAPSSRDFSFQAGELIKKIIVSEVRGSLILFTSYSMMRDFNNILKDDLKKNNITLLMQSKGISTSQVTREFKEDASSVLLGTESFWEGIDVPGKALETLAITRLPFQVPDEPIIEARLEELEKENKNPFYFYSIPEAIIKLKQGFGRLIRHRDDYGVVLILDKRIAQSKYGKYFTNSIPVSLRVISDEKTLLSTINDWFKTRTG